MAKIYTKNTWQDEILSGAERYDIKEDGGNAFKSNMQINLVTAITQAATALTAALMNNIENGIDALDTLLNNTRNFPDGTMLNGKISVSVASNNLTIALKTNAGTDPTSANPVYIWIGGSIRTVTTALSVIVSAGTSTFNAGSAELATKEVDYFAYLSYRTASNAVVLGVSRIPYATLGSDFSGTATNEKYCAWSTAPAAGDDCAVIGRYAAILSPAAGYTWTVPAFTSKNLIQRPIFKTRVLSYVPTWTVITAGNGVSSGNYQWDYDTIEVSVNFTLGTTSSMGSGVPAATLPFGRGSYVGSVSPSNVNAQFIDTDTNASGGFVFVNATYMSFFAIYVGGNFFDRSALGATIPHTWAATDQVYGDARYRAA